MDMVMHFIDVFLHLDQHLAEWMALFGPWLYLIVFLIIFAETGLVVTPILPGDSLLFAIGALCTVPDSVFEVKTVCLLLIVAGILGDATNYSIGKKLGPKVFNKEKSLFFNRSHLLKAQEFYEKYGAMAIVIARFMPIVRTFAPFVAGIGKMQYRKFALYNILGAILWVLIFILAGYFFGNLPVVKRNFHIVIFAVIILSVLPVVYGWVQMRIENRKQA